MKKIIIVLFISILFALASSQAFANENQFNTITLKIDHVAYSKIDNSYYAFTENDESGQNWGLFIIDKPYKSDSIKWLNKYFKNLKVEITYDGELNDPKVELVGYKFVK